ncbi:MAG: dethiobiotin synthase [Aquificaceae bacterium]|nr:dethiobiotin synthase [Aquificaceae bacterium]
MKAVLITATDTSVGKTFVCYNIALSLRQKGVKVGYFKPVETGALKIPEDTALLCSVTNQDIKRATCYTFKPPVSPYAASLDEKIVISEDFIKNRFIELQKEFDFLLVEGAGGICVPINSSLNYANLAKALGIPTILVSRAGLGTINHTLLSFHYLRSMGVELLGIIMTPFEGKDVSEERNPQIIKELTSIEPIKLKRCDGLMLPKVQRNALLRLIGF